MLPLIACSSCLHTDAGPTQPSESLINAQENTKTAVGSFKTPSSLQRQHSIADSNAGGLSVLDHVEQAIKLRSARLPLQAIPDLQVGIGYAAWHYLQLAFIPYFLFTATKAVTHAGIASTYAATQQCLTSCPVLAGQAALR